MSAIDKKKAHKKALELLTDDLFWDTSDELTPFGNEFGDTALNDYRAWREESPKLSLVEFLKEVIEDLGEMEFSDYTVKILDKAVIGNLLTDEEYDVEQLFDGLDNSIVAACFAQLIDEGKIDKDAKRLMRIALERQMIAHSLGLYDEDLSKEYLGNLKVMKEVIEKI